MNMSPIAVRNKIKAIQARRPRLTVPSYYDSSEISRLNMADHATVRFSVISAQRLADRSKDIQLHRISAWQPVRSSVYSNSALDAKQSYLWTNYNSSNRFGKLPVTNSRFKSAMTPEPHSNKTPITRSRQTRQSSADSHLKSSLKMKSTLMRTDLSSSQTIPFISDDQQTNKNEITDCDVEFREYVDRAIVKCADWLIKYVFNSDVYESNDEHLSCT
jgi:hypothetical protein